MNARISAYDACINGMRKGWDLVIKNMLPNMILAFVMIEILSRAGLLSIIGKLCSPIMQLWGLPGESITVLLTAWLSIVAGVGTTVNLYLSGVLTGEHLVILLPGMYLLAAQVQYIGRLLSVVGIQSKYYPILCLIGIFNAVIGMTLARIIL